MALTSMVHKQKQVLPGLYSIAILSLLFFYGCGGGPGISNSQDPSDNDPPAGIWQKTLVKQLDAGGLLSPQVKAFPDNEGKVHITYLTDSQTTSGTYDVYYFVRDMQEGLVQEVNQPENVASIDNSRNLDLALDHNNVPVIVYQGGEIRECGSEQQSDAMLSIRGNGLWQEYTGATGIVERNPVFTDGLAGTEVSVAFDSSGDVHIAYQFLYEGCDSMNFQYPDLYYVKKQRSALDDTGAVEEVVEGNQYGGPNIQNRAGDFSVLVIDESDNPAIFYYAELPDPEKGLRVARRTGIGTWEKEWIETGCEIGGISAGMNNQGVLGVAYYIKHCTDGRSDTNFMKYASHDGMSWNVQTVDDTIQCGKYPSLSFDSLGNPAIAYYEMESHSGYDLRNLRLARYQDGSWSDRDRIASEGDIGLYNNLWFDDHDEPVITSYSNTDKSIYIFNKSDGGS
jgi:hypothetical protein